MSKLLLAEKVPPKKVEVESLEEEGRVLVPPRLGPPPPQAEDGEWVRDRLAFGEFSTLRE